MSQNLSEREKSIAQLATQAEDLGSSEKPSDLGSEPDAHFLPTRTEPECPDGGREAWLVVVGGWFGLFCTFGLITTVGVFLDYYKARPLASHSVSQISWITSLQIFIQVGGQALWGRVYDSYGPRWLLLVGTFTYVFGVMMLSLSTKYYQILLSQAAVSSLGSGAIFTACMTATTSWFSKRRGTVFGIVNSGSATGGVVLPILMTHLFKSIGFAWALRVVGFIFLAFCGISCLTVKTRVQNQPRPFALDDFTRCFKERITIFTMLGGFFFFWGMFLPLSYIIIQAQASGVSPELVPYLLPIINAISLIGRLVVGALADVVGRFNSMLIITGFTGILTLALWIPGSSNTGAIIAYAIAFGFGSGGYVSVFPACVAQISPMAEIGTRLGVASLCNAFGALTGSPLGGALISNKAGGGNNFLGLQLFCGCTMLSSIFAYGYARYLQAGLKWTKI
ncbi:hypothetical protein COCCADRAFT_110819 [Bipolaris zeicola 26-R-13]|uniref:Major facilitator superfamily (MFS) profile domain-containing protein n=1 Tax=Cochliobolus carbonum (strain 26-R-13) TaxID=930089 RepID=W6Y9K3_COCC2|nr:uncharacterized protein COCCADRAFT_110819 [Bipolaris zeicola 26-R-13]EUC27776.1 hypothetical protein COCCADRAFT_110819 [Bipolaris zeicola 26-R-13]